MRSTTNLGNTQEKVDSFQHAKFADNSATRVISLKEAEQSFFKDHKNEMINHILRRFKAPKKGVPIKKLLLKHSDDDFYAKYVKHRQKEIK